MVPEHTPYLVDLEPGEQVILKDLRLNILALTDSRRALVATSGYNAHELALVD